MKLWGGRFEKGPSRRFEEFSRSLAFDRTLFFADIEGSCAWARALERAGIFSAEDARRVTAALESLAAEARANPAVFEKACDEASDEDIHTLVIRKLAERAGSDLADRLHTGRSRNEQVSLDLRIWQKREIREAQAALDGLMEALLGQAQHWPGLVLPGYTHLRRAQPVLWAHYLLAYFEMLARDRRRLERCYESADRMPLGSGALAGSGLPIDRQALAGELGFAALTENSLDAAGDRDFALEFLFAASCIFIHLSRLAEDWILYSSEEFGFLELADEVTSGSSLMPQKKNPDALELIRGKTGRVLGHLVSLSAVLKGLPLSYNRDLQEDKESVFDAAGDRDFALEFLFAASCIFIHLSRLAEDWILYSSEEFGFLELADEVTSGSSLMPQKKNPDALELIRGKTGRVLGHLVSLAAVLKGLPLSYNRDLQEDKESVFDAAGQLRGALEMAAAVVATATPRPDAMRAAAAGGWSCATDLAEYLAQRGVAFRQAHETVGRIVRAGLAQGRPPERWSLKQLRAFNRAFQPDVLPLLEGARGITRRELPGGTGPAAVAAALREARRRLSEWKQPKAKGRKQKAESRKQKAKGKRQKAEGRRQEADNSNETPGT